MPQEHKHKRRAIGRQNLCMRAERVVLVTFLPEQESYPPEATQLSLPHQAIRDDLGIVPYRTYFLIR